MILLMVFLLAACEAPKRKPAVIKPTEDERIVAELIKEMELENSNPGRNDARFAAFGTSH